MIEPDMISTEPVAPGYLMEKEKRENRKRELQAQYGDFLPRLRGGLLEIGCGHGHWLNAYAQAHNEQFCIGVDLIHKRILKSGSKADKRELQNILFVKAEAIEFLELLPDEVGIAQVVILFPDPWPKKRHHRRRLIQPAFLELMARKMQPNGKLYFRTDFDPYFEWAKTLIAQDPHWTLDSELHWPMEQVTVFQTLMKAYQSLSATRRG